MENHNLMNQLNFTFSDTIAGYVTDYDRASDSYTVRTSDSRDRTVRLKDNTYAMLVRNLSDPAGMPPAKCATCSLGPLPLHLRHLLPGKRRQRLRSAVCAIRGPSRQW